MHSARDENLQKYDGIPRNPSGIPSESLRKPFGNLRETGRKTRRNWVKPNHKQHKSMIRTKNMLCMVATRLHKTFSYKAGQRASKQQRTRICKILVRNHKFHYPFGFSKNSRMNWQLTGQSVASSILEGKHLRICKITF